MKYAFGTFETLPLMQANFHIGKIIIEGREYEAQHRTIKTNLGIRHYRFPVLQFQKNFLNKMYFYTVTTIEDNVLKTILLPNVHSSGMVCLGKATENEFYSKNSLSLDEFVDLFWFTEFVASQFEKFFETVKLHEVRNNLPNLWMNEEYNLSIGWKRI